MKKSILLLALALPCFYALANEDSAKAAIKAEKSLKVANKTLKSALASYRSKSLPESAAAITADQNAWRQKVEKECSPNSEDGGNAGSAAEFVYAQGVQCEADAAMIRAKKLGFVELLR